MKIVRNLLLFLMLLVVAAFGLVNALVSSPGSLAKRVELREEFKLAGMEDVLAAVKSNGADEAMVQLQTFEEDAEGDEAEATGKSRPKPAADRSEGSRAPRATIATWPGSTPAERHLQR